MHIINCVIFTAVSLAVNVSHTYFWYFMDMLPGTSNTIKALINVMVKGNFYLFQIHFFPLITKH